MPYKKQRQYTRKQYKKPVKFRQTKPSEPPKPVTITILHLQHDLMEAEKAYRKFISMGEYMWAKDWERYANGISSMIKQYRDCTKRKKENQAEDVLRRYQHNPLSKPKNLTSVERNGVSIRVQQHFYGKPYPVQWWTSNC